MWCPNITEQPVELLEHYQIPADEDRMTTAQKMGWRWYSGSHKRLPGRVRNANNAGVLVHLMRKKQPRTDEQV